MSEQEKNIDRFRGQVAFLLVCKHATALATVWAFLWGMLVLLLRASAGVGNEVLLWGLAGLPLAVVIAYFLTRRQLPQRSAIRSLLDGHNHCGGLLMAAEEMDVGSWKDIIHAPRVPRLRWQDKRSWGLLALGLAFLAGCFLVPQKFAVAGDNRLDVTDKVEHLTQQVEVLKEEKILDAARGEELQKKLEQLRDDSSGKDPVKTLESIDRVEEIVKQKAKETAESAVRKSEQLGKAESLADLLRKKKKQQEGGLSEKAQAEAMQELARLTRESLKETGKLDKFDPETLQSLQDSKLSPEDLAKMLDALKEAKGDLKKMLGKLEKVKLIDADKLKECDKCGECDDEGLLAYLKKCEGKCSIKEAMKGLPGRGGINRGPAPAELAFSGETNELKEKLKEQALPQASLDRLKESKLKGVSLSDPKINRPGETTAGALDSASGGSGSAQTQVVLPRHRGAVERYFDRADKK
jgi:hypothetical protein